MLSAQRAWPAILLTFLAALLAAPPAAARQNAITVVDSGADYDFGKQMTFRLVAESPAGVSQATLFVDTGDESATSVTQADFTPGDQITAEVVRDLQQQPVRPFSPVTYWWRIEDGTGDQVDSDRATFLYEDNRFNWQTTQRGPVTAHWYAGDLAYGQAAADAGALALPRIARDLGVDPVERVDVYVYSSVDALQTGLQLNGRTWVAGHADPDLGVVLIAVPPGPESILAFDRDLPHELTHVLIYRATAPNYDSVPFWLNEGLAVLHETQPNPTYRVVLERAQHGNHLLPLSTLCGGFPLDAQEASLAYAESASLAGYVRDNYGSAALVDLLHAYADGATCEGGVQRVLHTSLAGLETGWTRAVFNTDPLRTLLVDVGPWALLFLIPALALAGFLFVPRRVAGA
jgi:Peptidase MA superfamily